VRQGEPLGLGHAVGTAASHIGDNAFAVLLGDEFVDEDSPLLPSMLDLQARTGGIVLAFLEVAPEETSRYGIASVQPSDLGDDVVQVTGLVEKPSPEEAPSNLAVLGRYILPATIFDAIKDTKPGSGGEIQLTDAMAALLEAGTPVHGIIYRGHRYDTGMPLGYLQAVVQLAVKRPDLGPEFKQWLTEFVGSPQG
jgi:UTP--glucose-1-phosphate uridylyltransferase